MTAKPAASSSFQTVLLVLLPLATAAAVYGYFYVSEKKNVGGIDYARDVVEPMRRLNPGAVKLDSKFTDADGDLVADPPKDAVDPATLAFAPLAGASAETEATWKEFLDHLAKVTGKKVEFKTAEFADEQLQMLTEGQLHVTGFNTGFVPAAVNTAGFVPVCVMAAADGSWGYEMEFLVPADSPVKSAADIKGKKLTLTAASSHSGYKAALVTLRDEFHLQPGRDYDFHVSGGHDQSIRSLTQKGGSQVVSVANDMLRRAEARGDVKKEQYRSIYKSKKFPPACFGHVYNLKPELAAKVKEAFLGFEWKGSGLEKSYQPAGLAKFVPVNYKDDWKYVREIDQKLYEWK
jgi:phosphonate transport system substrate-binding protein